MHTCQSRIIGTLLITSHCALRLRAGSGCPTLTLAGSHHVHVTRTGDMHMVAARLGCKSAMVAGRLGCKSVRVGVGGVTRGVTCTWWLLDLAVKVPWLEGGWCQPQGDMHMAAARLGCKSAKVAVRLGCKCAVVGTGWANSCPGCNGQA